RLGVHGLARARGNEDAPDCEVCHGNVHEVKRTGTEAFRRSIPAICGQCHDTIYANYEQSIHGKAVARGIVAAPVCSSCHGEHEILAPSKSASPVHPTHIPQTCGRCHADVRITERFQLPRNPLISYEKSVHGLALRSGSQTVANCASCHGVHLILPSSDPRSTINPANLPRTCGKCHPGAGTRFAIGHICARCTGFSYRSRSA
ncbi:MAG: cytochrome B, partial [Gemmatimonadota bacterium]